MGKNKLLIFSFIVAAGIFYYTRMPAEKYKAIKKYSVHTFERLPDRKIASHDSTRDELVKARIDPQSTIDRVNFSDDEKDLIGKNVSIREKRVLLGEDIQKYENSNTNLPMINSINDDWKNLLGNDLLLFQESETKVLVREEFPIIRVVDGKGQYLEQVVVTYVMKNGDQSSFRAYVDSESGKVLETWDRTINERLRKKRIDLNAIPMEGLIK